MTPTTGFVDDSSSAVSHSSLTAAGGFFLSLLVTLIVVCAALVNLVKHTASKYLRNPLRFQEGGDKIKSHIEGSAVSSPMLDQQEVHQCAVCAKPASKRCSRCKTTRYCSSECQTKHWTESHKLICKATSGSKKKGFDLAGSFGRSKNIDSPSKVSSNGTQMAACNGNIVLPKPQVLFPYESFIELFNWNKLRLVPCGLINCGNSCFANVVLQCLTCTRPLVAFLLESYHTESCRRMDWCFLCELYKHVRRVAQCDEPFSPLEILSRISKMGGSLGYGRQEDAHEFMRVAIDSMQSICLDEFGGEKAVHPSSRETTVIYHIFGGHLQSQVVCMQCSRVSNRYENMMDLTVEIHGDVASLEDALEQFTAREWLDGENKYKCDGCNAYVKACKRLTVHQPPNVLTVALKRFQTGRFGKLNKRVTFPETLDLSPYMSGVGMESQIYKLYAVVVHVDMLNASFFGHYICFVKDLHGSWYRVDDCKVKRVDLEEVLSQNAYMLLYSRIAARSPCTSVSLPCSSTKSIDECKNINPIIHSPSSSSSNSTDEYLSSPFEVVESLRSSLDGNSPNACGDDNGPVHKTSAGSIEKHVHSPASVALSSNASNVESVHEYIALKDPEPSACMSNSLEGQIQKLGKQEKQEASLNLFASKRKLQRCSSCPVLFSENIPDICQRETSVLVDRLAGLVFKSLKESNGIEISECSSLAGPLAGTCKQGILTKQNGSSKCIMNLVTHKNMDVDSELAHPSSDNERNKMLVCDGVMTKPSQEILLSNPSACFLDDTQNNNSSLDGCIFEPTLESGVLHRNTTEICMMDEDHTSRDQDIAGDEIRHANLEKHDFCNMQQVDMESLETEADATDDSSQKLDSHCSSMVSALNSAKPHLLSMPRNEGCHSEHNMLLENEENSPGVCRMSIVDTVFTDYPSNEFSLNNGQSMVIQAKKSEEIKPTVTPGFLQSPSQNLESKKALLKVDGSHSFVSQNPLQASLTFSENVDPVTSVTSKHAFDSNGNCNVPIQPFSSNKSVLSDTIDFLSTKENPVPKSHEMSDKSSNSVAEGREMRSFHSSGMTERKLVNKPKEKPLFPQGFLNGVPRAKAPQQAELSPKNTLTGIHSVAGIDAAVAESRLVTCRVHNSDCSFPSQSNRLSTDTLLKNVSPDKIGNGSVSDDKQVLCHGVKRALRAESLHKDKEISDDAMRAKRVPRQQKQGRNERCACGSQRKWKHCCGKLDLIRNVSVR